MPVSGGAGQPAGDRDLHGAGEGRVRRDEDGRGIRAVLGLGDEVGRDTVRVRRRRGEDHPLGRAGRQVDPDLAADLDLGGGDPGVARADDAIDRGEAGVGKAVGEGADRLRPAGHDERVDLEETGRGEEDRVRASVAVGRRGDDHPADTRDAGGDDGHDQ